MAFLATYWWAFLLGSLFFYALVAVNQIRRMKRIVSLNDFNPDNPFGSFFKGVGLLIAYAVAGTASGVAGLIGVVVAIINAVK